MCDVATIYCNNFNDFGMKKWHKSVTNNLKMLEGEPLIQESFDKYQDGFMTVLLGLKNMLLQTSKMEEY